VTLGLVGTEFRLGAASNLTHGESRDGGPRWSPDGTTIAFHSDRTGRFEIWTIQADGSGLTQVTHTADGAATGPVWSPQGTRIAYAVEGRGAFVVDWPLPDGPARGRQLGGAQDSGPPFEPSSWSRDGKTIAGTADGVVLLSVADGRLRRLTDFGREPVWVGRHNAVLFTNGDELHHADTRSGVVRRVFRDSFARLSPHISVTPDGRTIYGTRTTDSGRIWVFDPTIPVKG
jgi:Tol biopolymer transport system component